MGRLRSTLSLLGLGLLLILAACTPGSTQLPSLQVMSISPGSGPAGGGQLVTIEGTAFFEVVVGDYRADLSVSVCGALLQDVRVQGVIRRTVLPGGGSASILYGGTLTGITTAGTPGMDSDVVIRRPDGQQAVLEDAYDCLEPTPVISDFSVTPQPVVIGDEATFTWQVTNPAATELTCNLDPGDGTAPYALADCTQGSTQHTYASAGGFSATLSVESADSVPATREITVEVVARVPVAVDDSYVTSVGTPLQVDAPGVLGNDTTFEGTVNAATQTSQGGTLNLEPDGSFTYVPPPGFDGIDTFEYELTNPSGNSSATVTIHVQREPVAVTDSYVATAETTLDVDAATGVLANDSGNPAPLVSSSDTTSTAGGTVAMQPDGSFSYEPPAGFTGLDTFDYTISNAAGSDTATVSVDVRSIPVAIGDHYSTGLDVLLSVDAGSGLLANDSGIPAPVVSSFDTVSSMGGTVNVAGDGSFTYQPPVGFTGLDTFDYEIANSAGSASGEVRIVVGEVPVAADDAYTALLDQQLDVSAPGVLGNDSPNGATLTHDAYSTQGGAVSLAADGSFTYQPPAGFTGSDTFGYTLVNGLGSSSATVTIDVQ